LSDVRTKVFVMNQFLARQNKAVMALFNLQSHGVTENQILYLHNILQKNSNISV
jgi:hypothetical protein